MSEPKNEIVVYQPDDTMRLDVRLQDETVCLSQEQMVKLFGRDQSVIARHISNIFKEGELDRKVVYAKFAYTTRHGAIEGKTQTKEVGLCLGRKCFAFTKLDAKEIPLLKARI
ncbi:MAG: hypothetical protein K6G91_00465 [Kiritimatiellae bacterium]|nr:hypothetical protein [Kiritimatiellia bacterium]